MSVAVLAFVATVASAQTAPPASNLSPPQVRHAIFTKFPHKFDRFLPVGPYYPERAFRLGVQGKVVLDCVAAADGALDSCMIAAEKPDDVGFGEAALLMARRHAVTIEPIMVDGKVVAGLPVRILVPFSMNELYDY